MALLLSASQAHHDVEEKLNGERLVCVCAVQLSY